MKYRFQGKEDLCISVFAGFVGAIIFSGIVSLSSQASFAGAEDADLKMDPASQEHAASQFPKDSEIDLAFASYVGGEVGLFDVERAQQEGVRSEIVQVGELYNRNIMDPEGCVFRGSDLKTRGIGDPAGWGITERWNWCGRDRTDGGAPANDADRQCQNHDTCLALGNVDPCQCDAEFVNGLKTVKNDFSGADRIYIEAAIRAVPKFHGCDL